MKWTPEKIAELRALAPTGIGAAAISRRLGTTHNAVRFAAYSRGISIWCATRTPRGPTPPKELRRRWAAMIGPMKDDLRADIARIV